MAKVLKQQTAHIPDDALINIFLKLPARSLLPLKIVCKQWLGIIQNPDFIRLHLNYDNPNYDNPIMIMRSEGHIDGLISLFGDENTSYETMPSSFVSGLRVHGHCNGLFLMNSKDETVVFNPATKKYRKVPPSPSTTVHLPGAYPFRSIGLGFDSVSNDYKIASFTTYKKIPEDPTYKVEIFSLTTNQWREVENIVPSKNMSLTGGIKVFLNGSFHWLSCLSGSIFVFDLNKEAFKSFKQPFRFTVDNSVMGEESYFYLSVLNESLALIVRRVKCYGLSPDEFDVWVMKEYGVYESWSKLYNFSIDMMSIWKPLSFGKDGEFLLEDINHQLVSFNINTNAIKKLQAYRPMYALRYRESLIPLK